jgi:hypothetical protein
MASDRLSPLPRLLVHCRSPAIGEFSFKDEDYAEAVMTELGKVLLPVRSRR